MDHILGVRSGGHHSVHQAQNGSLANMRLDAKMPVVSLHGLVHLGITRVAASLGLAGRSDQGDFNDGTVLRYVTLGSQQAVEDGQVLHDDMASFEQMANAQDAQTNWFSLGAGEAGVVSV